MAEQRGGTWEVSGSEREARNAKVVSCEIPDVPDWEVFDRNPKSS
jgi:hypothetical protein